MSSSTILQGLLFVQVFVLGAMAAYAADYLRKHYGAGESHDDSAHQLLPDEEGLPPAVKRRLVEESELKIQNTLNHTATKLDHDLEASAIHINQLVNRLAADIVSGEMERYRMQLGKLHDQANSEMGAVRTEIAKHQIQEQLQTVQGVGAVFVSGVRSESFGSGACVVVSMSNIL